MSLYAPPPRAGAALALLAAALVVPADAAAPAAAAHAVEGGHATAAALTDLGLALLRDGGGTNAVVSPLAVATVLGLIHAGASGTAEHEIEALFGAGRHGARAMRRDLPALVRALHAEGGASAPTRQAARIWVDKTVAGGMPGAYKRRVAHRYGADAATLDFVDAESARADINRWTAEHTAGRVKELLPQGSVVKSTLVTLTSAVHFRSPWEKPFDTAQTESKPFATAAGASTGVATLQDERAIAQAQFEGTQVYALPFGSGHDLVLMLPAAGSSVDALLRGTSGAALARWRAALQPARCAFALPKFSFTPKAGSIKTTLQAAGVKTAFTDHADLRALLGRSAAKAHVDDVHHAAGMAVDENGGEAVAASAATVKPKALTVPAPACAVDRAFAFAVVHRATGAPLFMGRVADPTLNE